MTEDEAWAFVERAHTGVLTTLRADGRPVALPVWFVVLDRAVFVGTPSRSKKVARVARDPRASFLVEDGDRWAELRAVHLDGIVEEVDDPEVRARVDDAVSAKYAAYQTPPDEMPDASRRHYAGRTLLRFTPAGAPLSWDNAKLRLAGRS
jgi:PPOX class probable F420-dependent enzyme